eukprot:scaffold151172_cov19-Tisochrysis_lutea.AAC.3
MPPPLVPCRAGALLTPKSPKPSSSAATVLDVPKFSAEGDEHVPTPPSIAPPLSAAGLSAVPAETPKAPKLS